MRLTLLLPLVCVLSFTPAFCDDLEKVKKQLNRITAMSSDPTGRRVVSIALSDLLQVKRADLVQQRRSMDLSYGSLLLAHQMMADGLSAPDLLIQLKSGKTLFEIAQARNVDWKKVLSSAKKLNGKIEKGLFDHFTDPADDAARDEVDNYKLLADSTRADAEVTRADIDEAADVYVRERDLALQMVSRRAGGVSTADSMNFRRDQVRDAAPDATKLGIQMPPK